MALIFVFFAKQICLVSRDEQSVLIVSYAELRHCMETSFNELVQASKGFAAEAV
jgi:PAB-dependent poly(A)-specific ribonuclease subunit 3